MSSKKTILLEEAIRTMAIIGLVIFGVLPIAYVLGADVSRVALIAFPAAILIFPITFWIRTRTGVKLQIRSRRGWYISAAIAFALALFIAILMLLTGWYTSWNQAMTQIAISAFVIVVLAWLGARLMRLK